MTKMWILWQNLSSNGNFTHSSKNSQGLTNAQIVEKLIQSFVIWTCIPMCFQMSICTKGFSTSLTFVTWSFSSNSPLVSFLKLQVFWISNNRWLCQVMEFLPVYYWWLHTFTQTEKGCDFIAYCIRSVSFVFVQQFLWFFWNCHSNTGNLFNRFWVSIWGHQNDSDECNSDEYKVQIHTFLRAIIYC